jgi:hypothetical protein
MKDHYIKKCIKAGKEYTYLSDADKDRKNQEKYREQKKQNITYEITLRSKKYYGHTTIGLQQRTCIHMSDLRSGRANKKMQEIFNKLGEEKFKKIFKIKTLEVFDTPKEAKLAEQKLLEEHVGKKYCMNIKIK